MKIGVFGNEGSWYVADLERAAGELGASCRRLDFRDLTLEARTGGLIIGCGEDHDLARFDALIVRTMPPGSLEQVVSRMDLLGRLESLGVSVCNSPRSVECAVDKSLTTAKLVQAGLPTPPTWVGESSDAALEAFARLGGDVVVKPLFGAEGRGILRVSDPDLALRVFRTLERIDAVIYQQQFVDHPGFDTRVMVLDGEILGGMRRESPGDFRTNVSRNGKAVACDLSAEQRALALQAAEAIGTRIAGVDLLEDRHGNIHVIELNAVPGWRAFQRATGIDVARRLLEQLQTGRNATAPAANVDHTVTHQSPA